MTEEKIIMYDSPEAAEQITLTGWISKGKDGQFWYKDEHMARWAGCTHKKCDCGNVMKKSYTMCETCRAKAARERYLKLPFKEWDRVEPVTESWGDKYFFNEEDLIEYMMENDIKEIELLLCDENHWQQIDTDYWADMMPEDGDGDLPKAMEDALDALNKIIAGLKPQSYSPGKIRTTYILQNQ